jgi:hypothetical protein
MRSWRSIRIRGMSFERRTMLKGIGAGAMVFAMGGSSAGAEDAAAVFELRVYHTAEGRLPALLARFRDHTVGLFTKHGMRVWRTGRPQMSR